MCGVKDCRYKAKNYDVCNRHKDFNYLSDDKNFLKDIKKFDSIVQIYFDEANELDTWEILGISKCFGNNLCGPKLYEYSDKLKIMGKALNDKLILIREIQTKYDMNLVSNSAVRSQHRMVEEKCKCMISNLDNK